MKRSPLTAAALLAAALVTPGARAEDRSADAERLFREAQQLLEARDYANACPKLERAFSLDHKLGTLINLAFCHKAQETVWLAWLEFRHAEVMATAQGRTDRRDFVRQQLTEIERKGKLALVVVDNPRGEPITEVLVEDRRVPEAERGAVFMVEPTTTVDRKFTFRATGRKPVDRLVKVVRGDKSVQHVTVPPMEPGEEEAASAPAGPATPEPSLEGGAPAAPRSTPPPAEVGGTQRLFGWGVLGAGVVGVGVGSWFGVSALGNGCAGSSKNPPCTDDVKRAGDRDATVSTIAMAGGGVAVAAGIALVLTAPRTPARGAAAVTPTVGLGYAGLHGRF